MQSQEWNLREKTLNHIKSSFALDYRSLILFRVTLGLILLYDLLTRAGDLIAFYTDKGIYPGHSVGELFHQFGRWGFHHYFSSELGVGILFFINAIVVLLFIFGIHTRIVAIIAWCFLVSLHHRAPLVLQGGDIYMRLLLFWALFLPLDGKSKKTTCNAFSFVFIMQILLMYLFNALIKDHPFWHTDGLSIYFALSLDTFVKPLGLWMKQFFTLNKIATFIVWYLELLAPFIFFIKFKKFNGRILFVFVLIGFHIFALYPMLYLGHFPFICAVALLTLLPKEFWEYVKWDDKLILLNKFQRSHHIQDNDYTLFFKRALKGLSIALLLYVIAWNTRSVSYSKVSRFFPAKYNFIGHALYIDQYWNMFGPFPLVEDGYFSIVGTYDSGKEYDHFNYRNASDESKPEFVAQTFANQRWRKFLMNMRDERNSSKRYHYLKYLCHALKFEKPKEYADDELQTIDLYYFVERSALPKVEVPIEKRLLLSIDCHEDIPSKTSFTPANINGT